MVAIGIHDNYYFSMIVDHFIHEGVGFVRFGEVIWWQKAVREEMGAVEGPKKRKASVGGVGGCRHSTALLAHSTSHISTPLCALVPSTLPPLDSHLVNRNYLISPKLTH